MAVPGIRVDCSARKQNGRGWGLSDQREYEEIENRAASKEGRIAIGAPRYVDKGKKLGTNQSR